MRRLARAAEAWIYAEVALKAVGIVALVAVCVGVMLVLKYAAVTLI